MPLFFPFMSRRHFLKGSAAVLAGTFLAPQWSEATSHAKGSPLTTLKVGAIVPNSRHFVALGRDITTGLNLSLRQAPFAAELHSLEYDSSLDDAYHAADSLLKEGAHVIVATVGTKGAEHISRLCDKAERPLILATTGEDVSGDVVNSPFTFHSSLNSWQASYALGQWAAQSVGRRGMVASSFYDSGYDTVYAFNAGFTEAGGDLVSTYISHHPTDKLGFEGLTEAMNAYQPDFLYALYTGSLAKEFLTNTAASARIPLLGSPFLTEEISVPGVYSAGAWSTVLKTDNNDTFVQQYMNATGLTPSSLSVLGWDTGTLLATAFQNAGTADGRALQASLRIASFASPRGSARMDGTTQSVVAPVFLRVHDGTTQHVESELPLPVPSSLFGKSDISSGWIYPYLA